MPQKQDPKRTTVKRRKATPAKKGLPAVTVISGGVGVLSGGLKDATPPQAVEFYKGVLFGPPKSGKTTAACSGKDKVLLMLTEPGGDASLLKHTNVSVVRPTTFIEMHQIIRELRAPGHGYKRLVFDSVTFGTEVIGGAELYKVLAENRDPRRVYGKSGAAMNQLVHDAVTLRMDVAFITQLKVEGSNDEEVPLSPEEGEYPLTMAVQPMVYKILAPAVSFIGRTFKRPLSVEGSAKRTILYGVSFEDYGKSPAGNRLDLPDEVFDFNWNDILRGGE